MAASLWWLQRLGASEGRTQTGSTANGIIAGTAPDSRSCGQPFKTRIMMDNATDSRITAPYSLTAHYVAACNAFCSPLSAKYGGAGLRCNSILAAVLLYCHIAFTSTAACSKTLPTTTTLQKTSITPIKQNGLRQISGNRTLTQRINGALPYGANAYT